MTASRFGAFRSVSEIAITSRVRSTRDSASGVIFGDVSDACSSPVRVSSACRVGGTAGIDQPRPGQKRTFRIAAESESVSLSPLSG